MTGSAGRARLFLLLGDPVDHSLSPALQNAAITAAGLHAHYAALPVQEALVPAVMRAVTAAGGGGNVTVPHKRIAAGALGGATDAVRATGACNLFWWDDREGLSGDNTDVEAFLGAAERVLDDSPLHDRSLLILGAGGAARAAVFAALRAGVRRIDLLNRTPSRAESLRADLGGPSNLRLLPDPETAFEGEYDLVVNATSLGIGADDPMPLEPERIRARAALDLVYSPDDTPWVRALRSRDVPAEDGRRMLVLQAAAAFRRWFQLEPPAGIMEDAVGLPRPDG